MEHSYFHQLARESEGRREALRWLAGQLRWEHRLSELRPAASAEEPVKPRKPRTTPLRGGIGGDEPLFPELKR